MSGPAAGSGSTTASTTRADPSPRNRVGHHHHLAQGQCCASGSGRIRSRPKKLSNIKSNNLNRYSTGRYFFVKLTFKKYIKGLRKKEKFGTGIKKNIFFFRIRVS